MDKRHLAASAVVLFALLASASPATARSEQGAISNERSSIYVVDDIDDGLPTVPEPAFQTLEGPAAETLEALVVLARETPELRPAGAQWNASRGVVELFSPAPGSVVTKALQDAGLDRTVVHKAAVLDAEQKADVASRITGTFGRIPGGMQIVSVQPSLDGATFLVELDEVARTVSDLALRRVEQLLEQRAGKQVEVEVDFGILAEPALRNHAPNPSTFSGAVMRKTGTYVKCSTGFRMTQTSGGTPVMGSAHHCHRGVENEAWAYTASPDPIYPTGNAFSIYGAGLSSGDVSVWKGPLAEKMMPGIFIGDHTVEGSRVYGIKGALSAPIGASICYSGSYSGTMCNNTVVGTGERWCYKDVPCYDNLTRTEQASGMPGAGNGDSGGPAYYTGNGIYAAGVISGIVRATEDCRGEPGRGGRACSPTVLYAPITELLNNGYALNIVR